MDRSAILHIPLSQYAFVSSEKELTIRIRTKKEDLSACTLYYGDRAYNRTPMAFEELPMIVVAEDELFSYYEATFETPYARVCYYFKLEQGEGWTYYYGDQFTKEMPDIAISGKLIDGRSEYYQYPIILRDEILDVPEWFKNAVVYNIFPDSFASGEKTITCKGTQKELEDGTISSSRLGGTIKGITDNLDYIHEMGFNCIYLNPIFTAGEHHKYDVLDYYHIDPCFGSNEDFKNLVDEIHKRDMYIIIDGVFNHCSWYFFAFEDVIKYQEASEYKDWFYELSFPITRPETSEEIPSYACFAYERKMPKLNTSNKQVQEYFEKVCRYWIREYKIDGWRLDVANEVDRNFWRTYRKAAKEENPNAVLIGEVWENAETWLRGDAFDSVMNYDFRKHCYEFFATQKIDAATFKGHINQMRLRYPTNIVNGQLNLLDSHDVPRFLSLCQGDLNKWKLALIFLLLSPGVPSLLYGDEKGIQGVNEQEYRSPMKWDDEDTSLEQLIKQVIAIRKDYVDHKSIYEQKLFEDKERLFSFSRRGEKGELVIFFNASDKEYEMEFAQNYKALLEENIDNHKIKSWGYGVYLID